MAGIDPSLYAHSPGHRAVLARDYDALSRLLAALPRLADPSTIRTEEESLEEEEKADAVSAVIDRRDVPNRETPLHLAVCLGDAVSVAMLMAAGADCNLQNEQGWGAIQEAICAREEMLANIIVRCYQPLAWAKWCRRLPRVVASMRRMQDFYMEITFHFESSVIPFISTIAPSDTYKIWKRGSNLRADMTLAGFDGFRIQRSDQSFLFLGDGSEDGKVPRGTLCIIFHKDKQVMNASEDAGMPASEAEAQKEVAMMSRTNVFRPGIDVTQAALLPQLTWRRQERSEMVGPWKAKVYDMHHVVLSVKSRRVPGAMTVDEFLSSCSNENDTESEEFEDILTEEERKQLENALKMECPDIIDQVQSDAHVANRHSCSEPPTIEDVSSSSSSDIDRRQQDKKSWFGKWGKRGSNHKQDGQKVVPPRSSVCVEIVSDLLGDSPTRNQTRPGRHSVDVKRAEDLKSGRDKENRRSTISSESGYKRKEGSKESEYKKGLRPVLWLSPDFPLGTDELLPLLDILANKVKAIRRLRDLVTTKLPPGTFPVKVAIPVVPTIRVLVTFTKFEQLQPLEEFSTPPSSPGSKTTETQASNSWIQWMKAPYRQSYSMTSGPSSRVEDIQDPFAIPPDYTWTTSEERRKKMKERKKKTKKGKGQNQETIMPD